MENKMKASSIDLQGVSYAAAAAGETKTLLQETDMHISRGQWLAIVGANGSGKSTLAKLMAKLYPATTGTVVYSNQLEASYRPFVQIIFQNPDVQMMGETIYEDVRFGLDNYGFPSGEIHGLAMNALDKVGLTALADASPAVLSGGQKQLLQAAGCLAVQPEVLIFDEAASMLDPMSRQRLLQAARSLHGEGTTIVWITQLLDELEASERIVALESGAIVFDGSRETFFYPRPGEVGSACERLGFSPPYAVQIALELMKRGRRLHPLPFSIEELGKAVSAWE